MKVTKYFAFNSDSQWEEVNEELFNRLFEGEASGTEMCNYTPNCIAVSLESGGKQSIEGNLRGIGMLQLLDVLQRV